VLPIIDIKKNKELLVRYGWTFYSPLDEWRFVDEATNTYKHMTKAFVEGDYTDPINSAQFNVLLRRGNISTGDGRVFEVESFDPELA